MHARSPTAHPALPPSLQVNELRDRLMLLEVCQLIGTPHLLPLLRERAEATEMLLRVKGAAGAGDPTALAMMGGGGAGATPARRLEMEAPPSSVEVGEALRVEAARGERLAPMAAEILAQLVDLEGEYGWREAAKKLTLKHLHSKLEDQEKYLQACSDKLEPQKGGKGGDGGGGVFDSLANGIGDLIGADQAAGAVRKDTERLRVAVERAAFWLQPLNYAPKAAVEGKKVKLVKVETLKEGGAVLTDAQRARVLAGAARCSELAVVYRATPRVPLRPLASDEVPLLVTIAEAVAARLPPDVARAAPPRVLASKTVLALLSAPAALLAVYPTVARMSAILQLAWLLLVVGACLVVGCAAKAVRRRHAAAPAAITAAWAPWARQQLHRGMAPDGLKGYLARVGVDAAAALRAAADEHARRGGDARAWLRSVGAASYEDN